MKRDWLLPTALLLGLWSAMSIHGQDLSYPPKPGERDFIVDEAFMINEKDAAEIKQICDKLLTDKAIPIIVVTIESMEKDTSDPSSYQPSPTGSPQSEVTFK